jgi:pyruvate dehydrogenase E1 component alpha subunit
MGMNLKEKYLDIYAKMLLIREFEEVLAELFSRGIMHGTCHLCIGQEATSAGTVAALLPQDYKLGMHRSHGHALASGVDEKALMAEFFGRDTGVCRGMGGSMHIVDLKNNFLGTNGIVGGSIPIAAGAALSIKRKGIQDQIAVCFFGDGATNEGVFYESMNIAMLWKLPVLYICENNLYAMSTHITRNMAVPEIERKAHCFGMQTFSVDGNDAVAVYETVKKAREITAQGNPVLVIENTYRISGHSKSDSNSYRTQEEIELWKSRCPIQRMGAFLLENGISRDTLEALAFKTKQAVEQSVEFAKHSKNPRMEDVNGFMYV